ncbi:MAG TPA: hypothetical protein VNK43_01625, partial [Gemmatimonadales bacterium]|nr:hypothetical protein [Gemmatimonadales bacterium]
MAVAPLAGQGRQRAGTDATFRSAPDGAALGTVVAGAELAVGPARGEWVRTTIEGWIVETSLGRTGRNGFDRVVRRRPAEHLRRSPGGPIVARLNTGA